MPFGSWKQKELQIQVNPPGGGGLSVGTFPPLHLISDPNESTATNRNATPSLDMQIEEKKEKKMLSF